jgi:zinc protease
MLKRSFILLFSLLYLMHSTQGQQSIPTHPDLVSGKLSNGFQYYILKNEMPKNMVSIRLATHVGSILEEENERGLAHFVEHMAFNGSENFKKNELINFLEKTGTRFGADLNAYTSFDETVYMVDIKSDDPGLLDKAFLVFEDWAGRLTLDTEEIDKERGVIMAEYRGSLGAYERMSNIIYPVQFFGSNYANRLPIGIPEVIEGASHETIRQFYKKWYRPDLMAIIVIGDVDVSTVEKEIKKRFAFLKSPAIAPPRKRESLPLATGKLIKIAEDKEATYTVVELAYRHRKEKIRLASDYRKQLIRELFGAMISQRLVEYTTLPEPPFSFAYSNYGGSVGDIDEYSCFAYTMPDKIEDAVAILALENRRILLHGFLESELVRAKSSIQTRLQKAVLEKGQRDSKYYSYSIVSHYLKESPFLSPEQEAELVQTMIDDVTITEINQALHKWIRPDDWILTVMTPTTDNSEQITEDQLAQVMDAINMFDPGPYSDEPVPESLISESMSKTDVVEKSLSFNNIVHWTLPNGVQIYYMPTDLKNDELIMSAMSFGGKSILDASDFIHINYAGDIVEKSGLGPYNANLLNKFVSDKVLSFYPYVSNYTEVINGSTSPRNLKAFFEMLYLTMTAPGFSEDGLKATIATSKSWIQNEMESPEGYFRHKVNDIFTQNHPMLKIDLAHDLDQIDLKKAEALFQKCFGCGDKFTFFFVGAANKEELKTMVSTYLGNLPVCEKRNMAPKHKVNYEKERLIHTFYKGKEEKASAQMKYRGKQKYDERSSKLYNIALSIASIKLRERIREDLGGVYNISLFGYMDRHNDEFEWTMRYTTDPAKLHFLMKEAHEVLEQLRKNGPEISDIEKIKEQQLQAFKNDVQNNNFWVRQLSAKIMYGEPIETLTLESLQSFWSGVTQEELKLIMNSTLSIESAVQFYLLPE